MQLPTPPNPDTAPNFSNFSYFHASLRHPASVKYSSINYQALGRKSLQSLGSNYLNSRREFSWTPMWLICHFRLATGKRNQPIRNEGPEQTQTVCFDLNLNEGFDVLFSFQLIHICFFNESIFHVFYIKFGKSV